METAEKTPLLNPSKERILLNAISKLNAYIVPIGTIFFSLSYINRGSLSFAANQFCEALGLTYTEYGIGVSLFYITYALFQVPSNLILERVGAPLWLAILVLGWGLVSLFFMFAHNTVQYYILRLLLGTFESGALPGLYLYTLSIYPVKFELAMSIIGSISCIVTPLATFLAAGLLALDGVNGLAGWQWLFFIEALIPIIFSTSVFILLPKDVKSTKILNQEEKEVVLGVFEKKEREKKVEEKISSFKAILKVLSIRDFWVMVLGGFFNVIAGDIMFYYMPLLIGNLISAEEGSGSSDDTDFCSSSSSDIASTLLSAIPYTTSAIVLLIIGFFFKKIQNRPLFISLFYVVSAISYLLMIFVYENNVLTMVLLTIGFTTMLTTGIVVISILASFLSRDTYSMGVSIFNTFALLGGIVGPSIAGIVIQEFGFSGQFLFASISTLLSAILFAFVRENKEHLVLKNDPHGTEQDV